ncbi:MAG: 3-hydroxyisobutyrate dehydrogenase [Rhodospirillaceae bacterium]|nr:3-hydroxyisobutyrate dehydrogenase [Rhodospirillaceae bacterium]
MTAIGFIGLGNMGGPMAANLAKAGHDVAGFDLVAASCEAARTNRIAIATDALECVRDRDIVVTMLPAGRHVCAVHREIVPAMKRGALLIDCSTIDVASARDVHALAEAAKLCSLDAPVSGGVAGATAATLTFMAGGSDAAFATAEPVLAAMGKRAVHCGPGGAGQAAKICNNMLLGISMIGACEAFALASKLGLDAQKLFDVVSTSSGSCWSVNTYCPVPGIGPKSPADNGYKPGFAAALMLKDLKLAQEAAEDVQAATPLGAAACALYEAMVESGDSERDFSAMLPRLMRAARET